MASFWTSFWGPSVVFAVQKVSAKWEPVSYALLYELDVPFSDLGRRLEPLGASWAPLFGARAATLAPIGRLFGPLGGPRGPFGVLLGVDARTCMPVLTFL